MSISNILLSHGSGTGLNELLHAVVLPSLGVDSGQALEDAAVFAAPGKRLALTTDSFVVQPLFFPGGDIGKLAACGTINDLAMMGAVPKFLSVALVLEEGLDCDVLKRALRSLRTTCDECGVSVCCGDTKVVEHGKGDGIYVTTSGIGVVDEGISLSAANARPGDAVLVSGPIGLHGIAILGQRKNLGFASEAISDCAPLSDLVQKLLSAVPHTRALRDATRGGCAAVLNEIAKTSGVTIRLEKKDLPVPAVVEGACSLLGMDPLQIANEGRFVAVVPAADVPKALSAFHGHALGHGAAAIGAVGPHGRFPVVVRTEIGGLRPVEVPSGELLPRIC